ncbi:hypothetical protein [Spirosoma areae]
MKTSLPIRFICCWLALLVLVSSTGFGIVEHWCQMRGHTKSLLLTRKGCATPCKTNEPPAPISGQPIVKKIPCCKTTLSYEHLDVSRFLTDQQGSAAPGAIEFISNPAFQLLLAALLPVESATSVLPLADDPLHRTGRFRLTSLCTWLI